MTDIHVEKRKKKPIWPWILALLAVIAVIWILSEVAGDDEVPEDAGIAADTTDQAVATDTDYVIIHSDTILVDESDTSIIPY